MRKFRVTLTLRDVPPNAHSRVHEELLNRGFILDNAIGAYRSPEGLDHDETMKSAIAATEVVQATYHIRVEE
jgi:hypothetical protein